MYAITISEGENILCLLKTNMYQDMADMTFVASFVLEAYVMDLSAVGW